MYFHPLEVVCCGREMGENGGLSHRFRPIKIFHPLQVVVRGSETQLNIIKWMKN